MYTRHDAYIDVYETWLIYRCIYISGGANRRWYTVSGIAMSVTILYWARSHGERGGGGGDSSDNIQIDSYHMAATGTGSSSSSSHISKANSDKQQLRQPRATAANSSSKQCIQEHTHTPHTHIASGLGGVLWFCGEGAFQGMTPRVWYWDFRFVWANHCSANRG